MQDTAAKMGIVYSGIEEALQVPEWEAIIREKFMTLIPPTDHKFAALHGAVWSGGSFVYVPKGVKLDFPLQSYFRLNAKGAGQFEHTLIVVEDDADLHFIEGCSAPKYNVANLHAGAVELFEMCIRDRAKFAFISANEGSWRVSDMCSALGVTRQGYYAWRRRPPSARDERDLDVYKRQVLRRSFSRLSLRSSSAIWKGFWSGAAPEASALLTQSDMLPASQPSSRASSAYVQPRSR